MSFLKKLAALFQSPSPGREYWIFVKCDKCGEVLKNRVDLFNDLSVEYGPGNSQTYFCRKVLIGSKRCYQPIEVKLTFDSNRRVIDREISGGKFIAAEAFGIDDEI